MNRKTIAILGAGNMGGITIRGLNAMEEAGFTASVVAGLTKI